MRDVKASAKELAAKLLFGELQDAQIDEGAVFGRDLASVFYSQGWKDLKAVTTFKHATYEALLGNGTNEVEITCGAFMGPFTQVQIRPQTHEFMERRKR